jgi:hypothetical protein
LEVTGLENEAATAQAQALLAKAQAEHDVIHLQNAAQVEVLITQVTAFKTGHNFARHTLYQKLAPRILSVLGSDDPGSLGGLFQSYWPQPAEAKP